MARMFQMSGWSRIALQPVLADNVRFPYYLLLVLIKSNTFLVPDNPQPEATPVFDKHHWWSNNRPTVFRESAKNRAEAQKPGKYPGLIER
jgi:hypothetical protein